MLSRFLLFSLIIFMSIAINMPDSMITRLGFDADYILAALVAMVIAALTVHRRLLLIVLLLGCSIGANLPKGVADSFGLDRDILFATLIALVVVPFMTGKVGVR